jgi:hypothetical protein
VSSVQARLIARLRAEGLDLPDGVRLERTHASESQRVQGAWSWAAVGPDGLPLYEQGGSVGSQHPMGVLLAADQIFISPMSGFYDVSVDLAR